MAAYKINRKAENDLRAIYRYGFFTQGEKQADQYYAALFKRFEKIAENPLFYPTVSAIRKGYRRSIYGIHSIYDHIQNDTIEIMRLLGRQAITKL